VGGVAGLTAFCATSAQWALPLVPVLVQWLQVEGLISYKQAAVGGALGGAAGAAYKGYQAAYAPPDIGPPQMATVVPGPTIHPTDWWEGNPNASYASGAHLAPPIMPQYVDVPDRSGLKTAEGPYEFTPEWWKDIKKPPKEPDYVPGYGWTYDDLPDSVPYPPEPLRRRHKKRVLD